MNSITEVNEIRRDGIVLNDTNSAEVVLSQGYPIEKIVRITWRFQEQEYSYSSPNGLTGMISPNKDKIIAIRDLEKSGESSSLIILNPNGEIFKTIENRIYYNNSIEEGRFLWFEKSRTSIPNSIGVVFENICNNSMRQVDISCDTGDILDVRYIR